MCDAQMDNPATPWWNTNLISGEPFELDDLMDTSTGLLAADAATGTSNYYLPSFFYTDDSDPSYSPTASANDSSFLPGDYFSTPISVSPETLSTEASPGSPPQEFSAQKLSIAKGAQRRRRSSTPAKSTARPNHNSSGSDGNSSTAVAIKQRRKSSNGSASDRVAGNTVSTKLRSAKRCKVPQKSLSSPADDVPEDKRKARHSHNLVEKKYREHLNQQFERLLTTLCSTSQATDGDNGSLEGQSNLSKAAVLDLARRTIQDLSEEKRSLTRKVEWLKQRGVAANVGIESFPEMMA